MMSPRMIRTRNQTLLAAAFSLLSASAYADVVWPALYLEVRQWSWWVIGFGLLAEFPFVKYAFVLTNRRAAFATIVANGVSAILGVVLVPLAGIAWEVFPASLYMHALHWGTFNPITWIASVLLAVTINTVVEAAVYKHTFKFQFSRRECRLVVAANVVSVGAVFISLLVVPYKP